jgi:hypothetical protein
VVILVDQVIVVLEVVVELLKQDKINNHLIKVVEVVQEHQMQLQEKTYHMLAELAVVDVILNQDVIQEQVLHVEQGDTQQ